MAFENNSFPVHDGHEGQRRLQQLGGEAWETVEGCDGRRIQQAGFMQSGQACRIVET